MSKADHSRLDTSIDPYLTAAYERKAQDVVALNVRELTSLADVFIICSGSSSRQATAIAESIEVGLKEQGIKPLSVEGRKEGQWVLLDYGHVIYHVFYEPVRQVFDLEGLWIEAERIETDDLAPSSEESKGDSSE
jgi:ribosome-associated protein